MGDPFTQALHDCHFDEQYGPLRYRNGEQTKEADIGMYFQEFQFNEDGWLSSWLTGPLLDMGAGVGRHSLTLQEQFKTVPIENNDLLVETMRDRGVADPQKANMFALRDALTRDGGRGAGSRHGSVRGIDRPPVAAVR